MRKYIILFFLVFPFLFACNSGGSSGDVIPEDQMVAVLTAVHVADGRLINISQAPDTLYKYGTSRYLAVFKQFHTDSAQFRKSYQYYSTEPEKFADMYDKVLKNLQAKNDSINKLLTKESLARAKMQQQLQQKQQWGGACTTGAFTQPCAAAITRCTCAAIHLCTNKGDSRFN